MATEKTATLLAVYVERIQKKANRALKVREMVTQPGTRFRHRRGKAPPVDHIRPGLSPPSQRAPTRFEPHYLMSKGSILKLNHHFSSHHPSTPFRGVLIDPSGISSGSPTRPDVACVASPRTPGSLKPEEGRFHPVCLVTLLGGKQTRG